MHVQGARLKDQSRKMFRDSRFLAPILTDIVPQK